VPAPHRTHLYRLLRLAFHLAAGVALASAILPLVTRDWQVVRQESLDMELVFAEPLFAQNKNRRELARYAEAQISLALQLSKTSNPSGSASYAGHFVGVNGAMNFR
jgi:hypothetical protein